MTALDIPEPQVAVYYGGGAHSYHWRALPIRLDGASWVCATATFGIEQINLAEFAVVPLTRGARFPTGVHGDIFAPGATSEQTMAAARSQARAVASILGARPDGSGPSVVAAEWRYPDTALHRFGELVDRDITMNPARLLVRGSSGLVEVTDEGDAYWTSAERVMTRDLEQWREEKTVGPAAIHVRSVFFETGAVVFAR